MMRRAGQIALMLALCPAIGFATPYDGTFRQAANVDCGLIGVDGGSVRIADNIFYGVEMECRMTEPVNVVDMDATLFRFQCSGNDQQWSERVMMMEAAEDAALIMVWNGYAFKYDRCPDQ